MPANFQLFGPVHLAILASVPLAAALLAWIQRRLAPGARWLRIALAGLVAADTVLWYGNLSGHGRLSFPQSLPLELCDLSVFLIVIALLTLNALVFDVVYYTALAGAGMALLTPNLWEPFPSLSTVQFFVNHGVEVMATLFLVWSGLSRPRPWSVARALLFVNGWAVVAGVFDAVFKTDYMYLCAKPANPSLLDLLGPWPWYIASSEGVGLVLFLLLYLPFRRSSRNAAPEKVLQP